VLLHGDLHHENVLRSRREPWLAIDPKGVAGEPAYEAGALLRNPYPRLLEEPEPGRLASRRLDRLAGELKLDRSRLRDWAFAQAVLSAIWHLEDGDEDGWPFAMACAELLERA
jgi:streptomycin 6-kinase